VAVNNKGGELMGSKTKKNDYRKDTKFLLKAYEEMLLIRRFEEKAGQLYGMGQIGGFCHLYIGQEAVAIGVQSALSASDAVITSYRDHGQMLATGSDPKAVMAELLGRADGCSKGKGGSMHMFDLPKRFYGGHGIVGAQVPIGTGIAFAFKYRKERSICVTYFGDGAANQGQVFEAFNMAKLWDLPVLYIVENNQYAMGTSLNRSSSETELYKRGLSLNIPGKKVDGMNLLSVYESTLEAVDYVKSGNGPMLLEMETYRYRGHSMSDPARYRSKEEVEKYKKEFDPIEGLQEYLFEHKLATTADLEEIEKKVVALVQESIIFAQNSPEPDESELYTDVYA
jgi:pyruvate dehydrogenase E1 component alpha subunit